MVFVVSILLVAFFLLMNAFFVVAEFSLVRVRKSQIDILLEEGARGAKRAKEISENVNAYLSACQLGITLASLAIGWVGEPAVSSVIHEPLAGVARCSGFRDRGRYRLHHHHSAARYPWRTGAEIHGHLEHRTLCALLGHAALLVLSHHVPHHVALQLHH